VSVLMALAVTDVTYTAALSSPCGFSVEPNLGAAAQPWTST
jgi:hypothetical protein